MLAVGAFHEWRPPAAGVVADTLALDFDHVGTKVGQHLPRPGSGQNAGQFEDAQTRQRLRHFQELPDDAEWIRLAGVIVASFRAGQTGNYSLLARACALI